MKVSVVIPVYNVEKFVLRCIESIINQTMMEEVGCIIVNDCTPDNSMEIINQRLADYNGNIHFKIINHERIEELLSLGIQALKILLGSTDSDDCDDYCEPNMLDKIYEKAVEEDLTEPRTAKQKII